MVWGRGVLLGFLCQHVSTSDAGFIATLTSWGKRRWHLGERDSNTVDKR